MPDAMDAVQQFNDDHVDDALRRHAQRPVAPGRPDCANADCGEAISAQRQALGAALCLTCQRAEEAQGVHLRAWRGAR